MKLKLLDILKNVGSEIIRNAVPGGSLIVSTLNSLLPSTSKLDDNATGDDITKAIYTLPEDKRADVLGQKFEVEKTLITESSSCLQAAIEADTKTPQTTRPKIALGCFRVVAFIHICAVCAWGYGVVITDELVITSIMQGWPFILALTGPFTTVLIGYFGILRKEHKQRLDAAQGITQPKGIISGIIKLIGK